GNLPVEGRDRRTHHRSRVALDDNSIWFMLREDFVDLRDDASRDAVERLTMGHEVEVDIRFDLEDLVDLIKHFAVLSGDDDDRFKVRVRFERFHHWSHLDGLWPSSIDNHDLRDDA